MTEVFLTLLMTALACASLGSFLVLRRLAMTCDGLAHSVLLGIVLAFFIVHDLSSIYLIVGAAAFGLLTVYTVELLGEKGLVKKNDALGIVVPLFFSMAVLLISKFFRNVHLDIDMVLMGEILLTPFTRLGDLPKSLVVMSGMLVINLGFSAILYRILQVATFDADFARLQGIPVRRLFYGLMTLTSMTAVLAFDTIGSILVISFFVAPAAAALLVARSLWQMITYSLTFAALNAALGFWAATTWNLSVSGMCSLAGLITVTITVLVNSEGLIAKLVQAIQIRRQLHGNLILIHLWQHHRNRRELGFEEIRYHLNWTEEKVRLHIKDLEKRQLVRRNESLGLYELTDDGRLEIEEMFT